MRIIIVILVIIFISCGRPDKSPGSIELIASSDKQDSIFSQLIRVTNSGINESVLNDSIAFLVLPVQASCPSCRKKTIDSIIKYQERMPPNHFIVISAKGGKKHISGYFKEEEAKLPVIEGVLFLDSTDQAADYHLYDKKPTLYYAYSKKAYKKVSAVPATVKQDLQEFFSGYRSE